MKELLRMSSGIPRSGYSVNIEVNDKALQILSADEIKHECNKRRKTNAPVHVSLSINNVFDLEIYYEFLKKLEGALGANVKVDIYTSGHSFNTLMDSIRNSKLRDKIVVHIDDHDVRQVIDTASIDLAKVSCSCEFSRKYIRNFNIDDFNRIYMNENFIFDRERALEERKIIIAVWRTIGLDETKNNRIGSLAKTILVADFINNNISYAHNGHRIIGKCNGINQHFVEEWARDGLLTYRNRSGVCSGQSELAEILLNNYYTRTNCFAVSGVYRPMHDLHVWIAVREQGENYGVCLTLRKRFVDLGKLGYENHEVKLESGHHNRDDYLINLDSYVELPREKYNVFKTRVYEFLSSGDVIPPLPQRRVPRPLPKRKSKINSLPTKRLPRRVSDEENK